MSPKIRVAIVYGGRSAEHEVSVVSARCVIEAIDRDKYEVLPIAITKAGRWILPERGPEQLEAPKGSLPMVDEAGTDLALRPSGGLTAESGDGLGGVDVVFPLVHGPFGEDGTLQGMLEMAGVPYVGAGVLASALGMDKEMQRRLFAARGLPLLPWIHVHESDRRRNEQGCVDLALDQIGLPAFTKPARLGSSVGVAKCKTKDDLREGLRLALRYDDKAIVERAATARELECAVLGNDDAEASVVGEIVSAHEFYDYEAKYIEEASRTIVPAQVPSSVSDQIRRLSIEAFAAVECRGMARVDFFYEEATGAVFLNEINTIPGFTPISMYPKLWEASGVPYAALIDRLIELALPER
ncbi:MAG TPA: D-alanine--D-alanine ligase family protein [Actinomycetota bacterium]|nr:D-alanine--D-alanine ligase family protein [Actinomycetota bacterium]